MRAIQVGKVDREFGLLGDARKSRAERSLETETRPAPSLRLSLLTMTHSHPGLIAIGTIVVLLAAYTSADPCVLKPTFGNAFVGKPQQYVHAFPSPSRLPAALLATTSLLFTWTTLSAT